MAPAGPLRRRSGSGLTLLAAWALAPAARCGAADLTMQLYRAALKSEDMTELIESGLNAFVGADRAAGTVVIMFHEHSCGICHGAVPELEVAARKLREEHVDVAVAHMEASQAKEQLKKRFHLRGFPSLVVLRRRTEALGEDDRPEALIGKNLSVSVTADLEYLLRASKNAKMGQEKNAMRKKAVGKKGQVLDMDLVDGTALLEFADSPKTMAKAWFPLEALVKPDGSRLPYHRSEASYLYLGAWQTADMLGFLRRMLQPLVTEVEDTSREGVRALVEKDIFPSYFFCGGDQVTPGFIEAATEKQGKVRSFHVKDLAACPAPVESTSVLVYSPPGAQWAPSTKALRAAVARAGPELISEDSGLAGWIQDNAHPGLVELSFHNFADWVNAERHGIMVAVRGPRGTGGEISKLVEKRLRQVSKPEQLDPRTDLYTYANGSYFLGVVDASLDGLASFGISSHRLPRVVVFHGRDVWYEDENDLTVDNLIANLEMLPTMWKTMSGAWGWVLYLGRASVASFSYYNKMCIDSFGPSFGPLVMPLIVAGGLGSYLLQMGRLAKAIVVSLKDSDSKPDAIEEEVQEIKPEATTEAAPKAKTEAKKTK